MGEGLVFSFNPRLNCNNIVLKNVLAEDVIRKAKKIFIFYMNFLRSSALIILSIVENPLYWFYAMICDFCPIINFLYINNKHIILVKTGTKNNTTK